MKYEQIGIVLAIDINDLPNSDDWSKGDPNILFIENALEAEGYEIERIEGVTVAGQYHALVYNKTD